MIQDNSNYIFPHYTGLFIIVSINPGLTNTRLVRLVKNLSTKINMDWLECPGFQLIFGGGAMIFILMMALLLSLCLRQRNLRVNYVKIVSIQSEDSVAGIYEYDPSNPPREDCQLVIRNIERPFVKIILINHRINELNNLELLDRQCYYYSFLDKLAQSNQTENPNTYSLYLITSSMTYDWENYSFKYMSVNIFSSYVIWYDNSALKTDETITIIIKSSLNTVLRAFISVFDMYSVGTDYFADYISLKVPKVVQTNPKIISYASITIYSSEGRGLCFVSTKLKENCEFKIECTDNIYLIKSADENLFLKSNSFCYDDNGDIETSFSETPGTISEYSQ